MFFAPRLCVALAALCFSPAALADKLDLADVNRDACGLWHWDFTALRQTVSGKAFTAQIDLDRASIHLQCPIREVTGIDLRNDLQGATMVMLSPREGYAVLSGRFDQAAIVKSVSAKFGPAAEGKYGETPIWTWKTKGGEAGAGKPGAAQCPMPQWGGANPGKLRMAFVKGRLLASFTAAGLIKGIDTVSGKQAALPGDSALAGRLHTDLDQVMLVGAFDPPSAQAREDMPMLAQVNGGAFAVGEKGGNFVAAGKVDATDEEAAKQMLSMGNGFVAMGAMACGKNPECMDMVKRVKLWANGTQVVGEFTMPAGDVAARVNAGFEARRKAMLAAPKKVEAAQVQVGDYND